MKRVNVHRSGRETEVLQRLDGLQQEFASIGHLLDFNAALRKAAKLLTLHAFDVAWAAELEDDILALRHVVGNKTPGLHNLVVRKGHGLTGKVVARGTIAWVDDYLASSAITHDYDTLVADENLSGLIGAPLVHDGNVFGVLAGGARSSGTFGSQAGKIMELAAASTVEALVVSDRARRMVEVAVADERQRVALDLHDTVGATLFAMTASVRSMAQELDADDRFKARLHALEEQVSGVASAFRDSLRAIRATAAEVISEAALRSQCQAFERRTNIATRLLVFGPIPELSESLVSVLVYATREGLLNVEKHAAAAAVAVTLASMRKGVAVTVNDDGKAFARSDVPLKYGFGLLAVNDALSRVGGTLSLTQNPDGGASLRAWVPC